MRRTIFLAAVLFAASAQSAAAKLPAATEPGITVSRESSGAYVVTVPAKIYRDLAGHAVDIVCTNAAARLPAAEPPRLNVTRVKAPARRAPFRVHAGSGSDVCVFSVGSADGSLPPDFLAALNARGERFLADYLTATGVREILLVAARGGHSQSSWPAYASLPRSVRTEAAHLPTPGARPSGKPYGYYTDGRRRVTVAGISATGRRLSFAMDGDDATTNTVGVLSVLNPSTAPSGTLPVGPFPPAGTPLPDATVNGVTATPSGTDLAIAFSGQQAEAVYGQLAGKRVKAICVPKPQPVLGLVLDNESTTFDIDAPAQPTTLHIPAGRFAACSLSVAPGAPVVQVAVGEAGRAPLEDGLTSQALQAVARRAAGSGTGVYVSSSSLATSFANATVVLGSPADTPADRRVGVYSDQRTHLAVVARAMTGRRLYADFNGDVVKTNLGSVADLIPF